MGTLTDRIREIQLRIVSLEEELSGLTQELDEARAALGPVAPRIPVKPRKSRRAFASGERKRPIQPNSSVDWALRVLKSTREPLQVEAIIALIVAHGGPEIQKATLVSNLSRYVKHQDTFSRTGRNTYGLIEWDAPATEKFGEAEVLHH
jgi:hypothetical protein